EFLWRSLLRLLKEARAEKETSYHFLIPSLLMGYLAFEGYVDFCGIVLLPELWKKEKECFKGKGVEGKLEALVKELHDFSWKKDRRPYQTIKSLKTFRDSVVHAKPVARRYVVEEQEGG
ncbi:MAG TPA: hypothetical protein VM219_00175, partial [Phycisphaerae bacterium]|nr:hypothetical protein [Phycisphaerae bacterium]